MKNKLTYLVLAFIITLSLTKPTYCHSMIDDVCCSEFDVEAPATGVDCGVQNAYRYVSVGVGPVIFIPNIGLGYRQRDSQLGWDGAFTFSTIGYVHQLNVHLVGHRYFNPSQQDSAYLGLGLIGGVIFDNDLYHGYTLSPDFVFGKELSKKGNRGQFIEMHVAIPTAFVDSTNLNLGKPKSMYFPLLYIKYGTAF